MGTERNCQSSLWGREATSCLGGRECQYVLPRAADLWPGFIVSVAKIQQPWVLRNEIKRCPERCWRQQPIKALGALKRLFAHGDVLLIFLRFRPHSSGPKWNQLDFMRTGQSQPPAILLLSLLPQGQYNLWKAMSQEEDNSDNIVTALYSLQIILW